MSSFNQWQGIGNLGRDPQMAYTPNGKPYTRFSIAVDQGMGDQRSTLWMNIVCWNQLAERMNEWLYKGCKVFVQGSLSQRQYVPNGRQEPDHVIECQAVIVEVLSPKSERQQDAIPPPEQPEEIDVKVPF